MLYKEIGIDLGTGFIKITTLDNKTKSLNAEHSKSYKVEENINSKSYYAFLRECIEDFTKANNIRFASLNFTLPYIQNRSEIIFLNTPMINKKVLKKGIKYEVDEITLERNLPETHYLWSVNKENKEVEEYEILLVLIEREIAFELSKLKSIKWAINTVEIQPITLGKTIEGSAVILDFGHKTTKLYFYKDSKLVNIDVISSGGERFTNIIKEELSISDNLEAMEIKHSLYAKDNLEQDDNSDEDISLEPTFLRIMDEAKYITSEIKRFIRAFELQNNFEINNAYYIGNSFDFPSFIGVVSNELSLAIKPLSSLMPSDYGEIPNEYVLSVLTIMKNDEYHYDNLNFNKFSRLYIDFSSIAIGLLCLSIVLHLSFYNIHNRYDNEIDKIEDMSVMQEETISELDADIELVKENESKDLLLINAIDGIQEQKKWLSDILYVLPKKVTKGVILNQVHIDGEKIILNGYAKDYSNIGFFAMELEKDLEVEIESISGEESQNIFAYKIKDTDRIKNSEAMTQSFKIVLTKSSSENE